MLYRESIVYNIFRKYKHVNWALIDQGLVSGVNFITGILLARYLGLYEYGVYTLLWVTVLFVNSILDSVIIAPMMTYGPKKQKDCSTYYYSIILLQHILISILLIITVYVSLSVYMLYSDNSIKLALLFQLSVVSFVFQMQEFLRRYCFTNMFYHDALINDMLCYVSRLIMLLLLVHNEKINLRSVLWAITISLIIGIIVGGVRRFGDFQIVSIKNAIQVFLKQWRFAKWLTASAVMQWTTGNLYIIIAGIYLDPIATGAIRSCQNILGILNILFFGLTSVLPSHASRIISKKGVLAMKRYIVSILKYGSLATMIALIIIIIFSGDILNIVYGYEFKEYTGLLRLLSVAYIFYFISVPLKCALRATENSKSIFWGYSITTILTLFAVFPLLKYFDVYGAAFGILGVASIQCIFWSTTFRRIGIKSAA